LIFKKVAAKYFVLYKINSIEGDVNQYIILMNVKKICRFDEHH